MSTNPPIPRDVPKVETKYRRIVTPIPAPESIPLLEKMAKYEAPSMAGQPPIVWDRAEGFQVYDAWGNRWIDWSSGVLVTNAGHSHPKIRQAIVDQANHGLLHNFMFPHALRGELAEQFVRVAPEGLTRAFLLSTGSEAIECALKYARTWGHKQGGPRKNVIVTFTNAFHGRTLGSQLAGGIPSLKSWIVNPDPDVVQVPFPDGFRCPDTRFELFTETLDELGIEPDRVAAVLTESYQGGNSSFAPPEYIQQLRTWCDTQGAALIFDEVQAGFGRSGKFWSFEHYGVTPDLITCGKGASGALPLSAVLGREEIMALYPPLSMTVTHTANPICVAAALANLEAIEEENMVENSRVLGEILLPEMHRIKDRFADHIGAVHGKGLVGAFHMVKPGGIEPNADLAADVVRGCVEKGLMLFAPVGYAGASVKVSPPLMITEEPLRESIAVAEEAIAQAIG